MYETKNAHYLFCNASLIAVAAFVDVDPSGILRSKHQYLDTNHFKSMLPRGDSLQYQIDFCRRGRTNTQIYSVFCAAAGGGVTKPARFVIYIPSASVNLLTDEIRMKVAAADSLKRRDQRALELETAKRIE